MSKLIACFKAPPGRKSITMLPYIVCRPPGFALIASSRRARLRAIVHASPVIGPDYVFSCVTERAVGLTATAASFMSVCHPVPGLQ